MPAQQTCPCGRTGALKKPLQFAACCGRFIDHFETTPAPDAESLMRSRYSAFVLNRPDYLLATWHPGKRPAQLDADPHTRWLGLEVRDHALIDASHAEVEFVARCRTVGLLVSGTSSHAVRLHERSRFVREAGRWFYVDGDLR